MCLALRFDEQSNLIGTILISYVLMVTFASLNFLDHPVFLAACWQVRQNTSMESTAGEESNRPIYCIMVAHKDYRVIMRAHKLLPLRSLTSHYIVIEPLWPPPLLSPRVAPGFNHNMQCNRIASRPHVYKAYIVGVILERKRTGEQEHERKQQLFTKNNRRRFRIVKFWTYANYYYYYRTKSAVWTNRQHIA